MKKISLAVVLICGCLFTLVGCGTDQQSVVSNKVDENQVLLNRANKIPLSLDLEFHNLFGEDKPTKLYIEHYRKGKLVERKQLLSSALKTGSEIGTQAKISILNIDGKKIYVNALYDASTIESKSFTFKKSYEMYDYDKVDGNIKIEDNQKTILGYFGGTDNQNLGRPKRTQNLDIKKYPEIITIVLESPDK